MNVLLGMEHGVIWQHKGYTERECDEVIAMSRFLCDVWCVL